ncbi:MAG: ABC transporter permease [Prevotella sp.]
MKNISKDQGVLIFFVLVPLLYPLLYSWIYNNEVVREVPVAVVDHCDSRTSREFIRLCDASADVNVMSHATDMEQARTLMNRQKVKGIYYIPSDFEERLHRHQQATVHVYCDMGLMLYYKAVYQTATAVSQQMNGRLLVITAGNTTRHEDELATAPLKIEEVNMFNTTGGYGNFILPGVLILILQQTMVLGIGLAAGTAREHNNYGHLIPYRRKGYSIPVLLAGKALCYYMIYVVLAAYLLLLVPRFFHFVTLAGWRELCAILLPYIPACIFFGITVSCLIRYRENVLLLVVFMSVPLLFVSGVSWPQSNIPWFWQSLSALFPSTFAIRAFVRANTMGATVDDISIECTALWMQLAAYLVLACGVYRFQMVTAHKNILHRVQSIRRKREVKKRIKKYQSSLSSSSETGIPETDN